MDADINRGYIIREKRLKHFSSLFEEWFLLIERYCRKHENFDVPYFYNERANIGLLAAAAWRAGWLSLEEFQLEKGPGNKKKIGRCDLWLDSNRTDFYCEAKFGFVSASSLNVSTKIRYLLNNAIEEVKRIETDPAEDRLALAFLCPYISGLKENIDSHIYSFIEKTKVVDQEAIAWCFPAASRKYFLPDNKRFYPGIVLGINIVD